MYGLAVLANQSVEEKEERTRRGREKANKNNLHNRILKTQSNIIKTQIFT